MAHKRTISSDIFIDEVFCSMSYIGRLLWIGLITDLADDQGRFWCNPNLIRSRVFPTDDDSNLIPEIKKYIDYLCDEGKLYRYEDSRNRTLCQIVSWWKYQKGLWANPSKYPAPEGWIDRVRYQSTEGGKKQIFSFNWASKGGFDKSDSNKKTKNSAKKSKAESSDKYLYSDETNNDGDSSPSLIVTEDNPHLEDIIPEYPEDVNSLFNTNFDDDNNGFNNDEGGDIIEDKNTSNKKDKDLVDGILHFASMKPIDGDVDWCPEAYREIMRAVIKYVRAPSKREQKGWIKEAAELYEQGVIGEDIRKAVNYMRDNDLGFSDIYSIKKLAIREMIIRTKDREIPRWEL